MRVSFSSVLILQWDFPVSSGQARKAFTARTGIGRYGIRQGFHQMYNIDERATTAMSPGIQTKQQKWMFDRVHPQNNFYARMSSDGQIRSTRSDFKMHRIFQDKLLGVRFEYIS